MSAYSDYKVGALSEHEYRNSCTRENRREREYIDEWERYAEEDDLVVDDEDDYPYGFNPYQE